MSTQTPASITALVDERLIAHFGSAAHPSLAARRAQLTELLTAAYQLGQTEAAATPPANDELLDELVGLLVDHDAGFGLYKRYHWQRVVREELADWLTRHRTANSPELNAALAELEPISEASLNRFAASESRKTKDVLDAARLTGEEARTVIRARQVFLQAHPEASTLLRLTDEIAGDLATGRRCPVCGNVDDPDCVTGC